MSQSASSCPISSNSDSMCQSSGSSNSNSLAEVGDETARVDGLLESIKEGKLCYVMYEHNLTIVK